jgi:putative hemolysin
MRATSQRETRAFGRGGPILNVRDAFAVGIVVVAAILLVVTAALQAAIVYVSRARAHVFASRAGVSYEDLHRRIGERNTLIGALDVARTACVVFATSFVLYLVLLKTGIHSDTVFVVALIVAASGILLQALPHSIVRQSPERWGFALAPVALLYRVTLGWLGKLFDLPGLLLLRLLDMPAPQAVEEEQEEILRLVELEESSGGIEEEERQMIRGIIGLEDTTAREIMVPRLDIAAVASDETIEDAVRLVVARGFSRVPLYERSIDNIVGIIYAKDLLRSYANHETSTPLVGIARTAEFIPETKRVDELLAELRHKKVHIAIVLDEYGGTAGLVTIEDLIEEIVGEIEDEYDPGEVRVEQLSPDEAIVDGRASIDVLEELFGVDVQGEDVDTVGGFVYNHLGKIPVPGDGVEVGSLTLTVLSVSGHRIKKIRIVRAAEQPSATG